MNEQITLNIEPREGGGFYVDSDDMPELNLLVQERENLLEVILHALDTIAEHMPEAVPVEAIPRTLRLDLLPKAA
ncbi:MAG: hypothetical protein OXM59_07570 [Gammaproteobacteria bacterium]|nr:hypothetical protein [Gammaproteobacteria bacterium]